MTTTGIKLSKSGISLLPVLWHTRPHDGIDIFACWLFKPLMAIQTCILFLSHNTGLLSKLAESPQLIVKMSSSTTGRQIILITGILNFST